jgi:hypothetical protein
MPIKIGAKSQEVHVKNGNIIVNSDMKIRTHVYMD